MVLKELKDLLVTMVTMVRKDFQVKMGLTVHQENPANKENLEPQEDLVNQEKMEKTVIKAAQATKGLQVRMEHKAQKAMKELKALTVIQVQMAREEHRVKVDVLDRQETLEIMRYKEPVLS